VGGRDADGVERGRGWAMKACVDSTAHPAPEGFDRRGQRQQPGQRHGAGHDRFVDHHTILPGNTASGASI
jgi:hypothetical protein